jgi:hypothetical protein
MSVNHVGSYIIAIPIIVFETIRVSQKLRRAKASLTFILIAETETHSLQQEESEEEGN